MTGHRITPAKRRRLSALRHALREWQRRHGAYVVPAYRPTPVDHSAILHVDLSWTGPVAPGDPILALLAAEGGLR